MGANEFRITVRAPGNLRVKFPDGYAYERTFPPDALRERTVEFFNAWLVENRESTRELMVILGSHLYELIFPGDVNDNFKTSFDKYKLKNETLRVVLEFMPGASDWATWPWEFIYVPDNKWVENRRGFFISAHSNLILSRHVHWEKAALPALAMPSEDEHWKNRIAIVISSPDDQKTVNPDVIQFINALQTQYPDQIEIMQPPLENPTKEELKAYIKANRPNVVHFMGHGEYDLKTKRGRIAFVDRKSKKTQWWDDDTFADLFAESPPQLIFLHACEGARSTSYRGFRGSALRLVFAGIPNVVAMQYPIENFVAVQFAKKFYESLGHGMFIDEAVQAGRGELGTCLEQKLKKKAENFSDRRFGSPVVYFQPDEGFLLVKSAPQQEDLSQEPAFEFACPNPRCRKPMNEGARKCPSCRTWVVVCPSCKRFMERDKKVCDCGYESDAAVAGGAAAPRETEPRPVPSAPGAPHTRTIPAVAGLSSGADPQPGGLLRANLLRKPVNTQVERAGEPRPEGD